MTPDHTRLLALIMALSACISCSDDDSTEGTDVTPDIVDPSDTIDGEDVVEDTTDAADDSTDPEEVGGDADDDAGDTGGPPDLDELLTSDEMVHDPSGFSPLAARADILSELPVSITLRVAGKDGADDVVRDFPEPATEWAIPVLGLFPDHENTVELTFRDDQGTELGARTYTVQTPPLSEHLPSIVIDEADAAEMTPGMTLVSYYGHNGEDFQYPHRPFMFDHHGNIRWVLDFTGSPALGGMDYDDGIERLQNGNLYFANQKDDRVYEVDMLGNVLNTWDMPGFEFHHEVKEMPSGNFLVTVHKDGIETIEDHIIEIDRQANEIVQVWDLRQSLDPERQAWTTNTEDWIHVNALVYDESDDTIIISGRTQGVVKLTRTNEVVWILAPHKGWATAGDGTDLATRLLQPLDAEGTPITEESVLLGDTNHADFQWSWYQHAPQLMPDGDLILFDNGDNRNYTGDVLYSRAVEYDIDADAKTVQQVWTYGEQRGAETYSRIVSDVDYLPGSDRVIFAPGAVQIDDDTHYGKVVEIDYAAQEVVFDATITPPIPDGITFHRAERLPLYTE